MKIFFKPEDFEDTYGHYQKELHIEYCRIANEKLNALIESWPVVTGFQESEYKSWIMDSRPNSGSTHKARLAFIEPIESESCRHEPVPQYVDSFTNVFNEPAKILTHFKCKHCGVNLVAEWKAEK